MELKKYQKDALGALSQFLSLSRDLGQPENAFAQMQPEMPYRNPENQWSIPYVCVRIPTGGGKTLLAAETVSLAAKQYLDCDFPVVLWLVPSRTIKSQTVEALNNRNHAYRAALDSAFNREVLVLDVAQFANLRPQDLGNKAVVVVSTLQNFRVDDTYGRKIYAHHEQLEPHFTRLPESVKSDLDTVQIQDIQEQGLHEKFIGKTKCSFANLLKAYRPLVLVDEAHNARTSLTFETLRRVNPAAIVEFTATPSQDKHHGSNVIFHVGAAALKAEEMIKLPIFVEDHSNHEWEQVVDAAVLQRTELAAKAQHETDYVRPIVLFQAENKSGTVTVDVLKNYLTGSLNIDAEKIAVVTGSQRELDGLDILSPTCPIEFVITVEALKEGWDCPFAYVFCSLQNVSSAKDAEQLLGRVLRMPYAKRRTVEDLNWAYAYLLSSRFGQAADNLTDKLVDMGFNHFEVAKMVETVRPTGLGDLFDDLPMPTKSFSLTVELDKTPDISSLPENQREQITLSLQADGTAIVQISGSLKAETEQLLLKTAIGKKRKLLETKIAIHKQKMEIAKSPAERGEVFPKIPQLCLQHQGELDLFEPQTLLNILDWNINNYPAKVAFIPDSGSLKFAVDVNDKEQVIYQTANQQMNLSDLFVDDFLETKPSDLVNWLDRHIEHADTPRHYMLLFLGRIVDDLLAKPNVQLVDLLRNKFALARAIDSQMNVCRNEAKSRSYQQALFSDNADVQACFDAEFAYEFKPENYVPQPPFYSGKYQFGKHFFAEIENLKASGEEFECAKLLDMLPEIKYWVRNPDLGKRGFWLPLSNRRFFPDFICELQDGRIFIAEYKGEAYKSNDDSKEKCTVGEYWAAQSGGKGVFAMLVKQDELGRDMRQQILAAFQAA